MASVYQNRGNTYTAAHVRHPLTQRTPYWVSVA